MAEQETSLSPPPPPPPPAPAAAAEATAGHEGGRVGGGDSTAEDSLQHSETSFPDIDDQTENDDRSTPVTSLETKGSTAATAVEETAATTASTVSPYQSYHRKTGSLVSSLEPSPATSVRKTDSNCEESLSSGRAVGDRNISSASLEPSPEIRARKAEPPGGAGSGVGAGNLINQKNKIDIPPTNSSTEMAVNKASNGDIGGDGRSVPSGSANHSIPTRAHSRQPSIDTSVAASTLTSTMNNNTAVNNGENTNLDNCSTGNLPPKSIVDKTSPQMSSSPHMAAPVRNVSIPSIVAPVAMSDVGSIGSVPSTLESLGGGGGQQQQQPTGPIHTTTHSATLAATQPNLNTINSATNNIAQDQHRQQQELNHDSTSSPVVAADSVPPSPIGGQSTTNAQAEAVGTLQQQQQQHHSSVLVAVPPHGQHGLYYQVPRVVTLPVEGNGAVASTAVAGAVATTPTHSRQASSASLVTISQQTVPLQTAAVAAPATVHPDQVIGMVGAIPVVKIQGGGLHYVKKKKGRFNLLQEAPAPSPSGDQSSVPNNITVPARSQSPLSTISQGASIPPSQHPQTFDGKSLPTVKKKGRFMVTNVKNPGSMQNLQQQQQQQPNGSTKSSSAPSPPDPYVNAPVTQETLSVDQPPPPQQPVLDQAVQPDNSSLVGAVPNAAPTSSNMSVHQVMIQPIAGYGTQQQQQYLQSTVPVDVHYDNVQYSLHPHYTTHDPMQQNNHPMQPRFDGSVAVTLQPNIQQVIPLQQYPSTIQQQPLPQQQQQQHPQLETISNSAYSHSQQYVTAQQSMISPPQTPNVATAPNSQHHGASLGTTADLSPSHGEQTVTPLPNVPIPKAPVVSTGTTSTHNEKQQRRQIPVVKKKPQQQTGRSFKLPQSLETGGLGKMFYFLDQMKKEVTDADRCIKSLQSDMKLLRDKNKELEAKNRDLEKKVRDEKSFREKAETRIADLKQKLKDVKSESAATVPSASITKVPEDIPVQDHEGLRTRSGSFSMEKPKNVTRSSTGSVLKTDASKPSVAAPLPKIATTTSTPTKGVQATTGRPNGNQSQTGIASPSASAHSFSSDATKRAGTSPQLSAKQSEDSMIGTMKPQKLDHDNNNDGKEKDTGVPSKHTDNSSLPNSSTVSPSPKPTTYNQTMVTEAPASASAAHPSIPSLQHTGDSTQNGKPGHRHTHSLNDFDPFRADAHLNSESNLQQALFFPASMSLSTLPAYTAPETGSTTVASSEFDGTFMSSNPFVVPVTFGMTPHPDVNTGPQATEDHQHYAPATLSSNGQAALMTNGFTTGIQQQPQFLIVPQYGQPHQAHAHSQYVQNHVLTGTPAAPQMQPLQQQASQHTTRMPPAQQQSVSQPSNQPTTNALQFDPLKQG